MASAQSEFKIFILTPIGNGTPRKREIHRIQVLVETIDGVVKRKGGETICALREEYWKPSDEPVGKRDFDWMVNANGAIAIPKRSYGVRIEEGWATAFGTPMLRLWEEKGGFWQKLLSFIPWMKRISGPISKLEADLSEISQVFDAKYGTLNDVERHVEEFLHNVLWQ